jgi:hypothetical protein
MTHARSISMLAVGTAAAIATAIARWRNAETFIPSPPAISVTHVAALPAPTDSVLDDATDATITNDPFRLANEPSSVRYEPAAQGGAPMSATPVVRPTLVLKAIIGGPPWQAVIDGIPGQPAGAVASSGTRFDKLVVRSVSRDSVVVQGPDTAWTLSFKGRM